MVTRARASLPVWADLPAVVVGGVDWGRDNNNAPIQTVRELKRTRNVLYLYTEARGSVQDRVRALGRARSPGDLVRTGFALRPQQAEETLWLAPLQGLSAVLPLGFPEPLRRHNVRLFRRAISQWLRAIGADRCLLICYWWFVPELVRAVPSVASIYDCVDEHAHYPGSSLRERTVRRIEARQLDAVDCSFVVSPALLPPREAPGRDLTVLPNAFDTRFFAEVLEDGLSAIEPLRSVDGPVIGCIGCLDGRIDAELVRALVHRRPAWTFVFIGPDARTAVSDVADLPNVLVHGVLPYGEALKAISRFDVGIIPFRNRAFTRGNSFLKLLDHFAHGVPVVATPLPDTTAVAKSNHGLIRLAEEPEAWLAALTDALAEPQSSPQREARRRYARERSVERRVERMLNGALGTVTSDSTSSGTTAGITG